MKFFFTTLFLALFSAEVFASSEESLALQACNNFWNYGTSTYKNVTVEKIRNSFDLYATITYRKKYTISDCHARYRCEKLNRRTEVRFTNDTCGGGY